MSELVGDNGHPSNAEENDKTSPVKSPLRRRLIRSALAMGMLSVPAAYAHYLEPGSIRIARVEIPLKVWPRALDGFRIGHINDLHADSKRAVARTREAVRILKSQNPDAVFITGDYITRRAAPYLEDCAEALGELANSPRGAYAVLGNHDWRGGEADTIAEGLRDAGLRVLINESAP